VKLLRPENIENTIEKRKSKQINKKGDKGNDKRCKRVKAKTKTEAEGQCEQLGIRIRIPNR